MSYYTIQEARDAFERRRRFSRKSATEILAEDIAKVKDTDRFDIFLSHCLKDEDIIAGVVQLLQEKNFTVYVDWIVDKQLDRTNVTPETADVLRKRMRASEAMLFATSESSPSSKWMPWELGYFDGLRQGRIAVMPLVRDKNVSFRGQEYLGLYPVVEHLPEIGNAKPVITPGHGVRRYIDLKSFEGGSTSFRSY